MSFGGAVEWNWRKNDTPLLYVLSAGHHGSVKNVVFIAGSGLKPSVFKAGTTVHAS